MSTTETPNPPFISGENYLIDGEISQWTGKFEPVFSPITYIDPKTKQQKKHKIGWYAYMTETEAKQAVDAAVKAFGKGKGAWPNYSPEQRIECMNKFVAGLREKREEIVNLLMWEICKSRPDAEKEVDRTILYIKDTITELERLSTEQSKVINVEGFTCQVKRAPLGTVLCVAPFNYPLNETYTTLVPALLMGNTVVLKTPRTGGLCHLPTLELFQESFPAGVVNIIHGGGRDILPTIMKTGLIDVFAFIGTSKVASQLIQSHPYQFKLRNVLGLDAKNAAFVLPEADIDVAVKECLLGSLSYNGQRCTALKLIFVHETIADEFTDKFAKAVDQLKIGFPWDNGVNITPLAEVGKPAYLREVIEDAINNGAKIINPRGEEFIKGNSDNNQCASLFTPVVLYPVNEKSRVYREEQFGPCVPIVKYSNLAELETYIQNTSFGQQAAVFIKTDNQGQVAVNSEYFIPLVDLLQHHVSRININCQCQRGPDSLPFVGRKNSAVGTLSVFDALRSMSIRTLVAAKDAINGNVDLLKGVIKSKKSSFLSEFETKKTQ
ncbi:hypothetical protein ABK040_014061 [Willaertia magna]